MPLGFNTNSLDCNMLRILGDPNYVLKFQNLCGLERTNPIKQEGSELRETLGLPSEQKQGQGQYSSSVQHVESVQKKNKPLRRSRSEENLNGARSRLEEDVNYNPYVHSLYFFSSALGDEAFYLVFFPFLLWTLDDYIGRRLLLLWAFAMYIGQGLKDVLRWPRPASPPVIVMESRYITEYGMPSTHAIVGSIMPFCLVYFSYDRYQYPFYAGLAFFVFWCGLVCMSRIYMGVHNFQDIGGGLAVSAMVIAFGLPILDSEAEKMLLSPNAGIFIILIPLVMCLLYPSGEKWTSARGDTTRMVAGATGAIFAYWLIFYIDQKPITDPYEGTPFPLFVNVLPWLLVGMAKFVVGVCLIAPVKLTFKPIFVAIMPFLLPESDVELTKRLGFEIPYIFITYCTIGTVATYIGPKVFTYLGLPN